MTLRIFEGQGFGIDVLLDFLEWFGARGVTGHWDGRFGRDLDRGHAGFPLGFCGGGREREGDHSKRKKEFHEGRFSRWTAMKPRNTRNHEKDDWDAAHAAPNPGTPLGV